MILTNIVKRTKLFLRFCAFFLIPWIIRHFFSKKYPLDHSVKLVFCDKKAIEHFLCSPADY